MSDNLWAPWRMAYIRQLEGERRGGQSAAESRCFLCAAANLAPGSPQARQAQLLLRDERGIILLNRYPYVNGHLLVAITEHLGDLTDLTAGQRAGLMELTALAEKIVVTATNPQGVNIGVNIGRCAGAGLPGHLHVHVVPRWNGDTNFMQTIGQVRVIPQALEESFSVLSAALKTLSDAGSG